MSMVTRRAVYRLSWLFVGFSVLCSLHIYYRIVMIVLILVRDSHTSAFSNALLGSKAMETGDRGGFAFRQYSFLLFMKTGGCIFYVQIDLQLLLSLY